MLDRTSFVQINTPSIIKRPSLYDLLSQKAMDRISRDTVCQYSLHLQNKNADLLISFFFFFVSGMTWSSSNYSKRSKHDKIWAQTSFKSPEEAQVEKKAQTYVFYGKTKRTQLISTKHLTSQTSEEMQTDSRRK